MDDQMQDSFPSLPRNRKRSSVWLDENELTYSDDDPQEVEYTHSKRLLGSKGESVPTNRVTKYNAPKLLNHLAFTRVYVTANFQNYNPSKSYIVLCMLFERNELYQALCDILPALYPVSPSLQALAITDGDTEPITIEDPSLLRTLPLVRAVDLELSVADDFREFWGELSESGSCVALIDPRGVCVWTSTCGVGGMSVASSGLQELREELVAATGSLDVRDFVMQNG